MPIWMLPPCCLALAKRDPKIDRATVYRTLELLKRLGLIDELDLMHLNGEKHYYEVKTQKDHLHLACFHCGEIEEFDSPTFQRLKREIAAQNDFDDPGNASRGRRGVPAVCRAAKGFLMNV